MSQSIKLGLALGLTTMGRWRGEQWETLFEGDYDFVLNENAASAVPTYDLEVRPAPDGFLFTAGIENTFRVRLDGAEYVCETLWRYTTTSSGITFSGWYVGNPWLGNATLFPDDNGIPFVITSHSLYDSVPTANYITIRLKSGGTHSIKIERLVS